MMMNPVHTKNSQSSLVYKDGWTQSSNSVLMPLRLHSSSESPKSTFLPRYSRLSAPPLSSSASARVFRTIPLLPSSPPLSSTAFSCSACCLARSDSDPDRWFLAPHDRPSRTARISSAAARSSPDPTLHPLHSSPHSAKIESGFHTALSSAAWSSVTASPTSKPDLKPYLASIFLGVQSLLHRLRFISNFNFNLRKIHIQKLQILHQRVIAHRQSALLEEPSLRIRIETPSDRVHQDQSPLVLHATRHSTALAQTWFRLRALRPVPQAAFL